MPDLGLTKALRKAVQEEVLKGAKGAKVMRPGEKELAKKELEQAMREEAAKQADPLANQPAPIVAIEDAPEIKAVNPQAVPEQQAVPQPAAPRELAPQEAAVADLVVPKPPEPVDIDVVAPRLAKANLGDYSLDESYMPNFDTIETTDDLKAVIADLAEMNQDKINTARRGVVTDEQARREALALIDDLGGSHRFVETMLGRQPGEAYNQAKTIAARQVVELSAMRIKALAGKHAAKQATPMEQVQLARQVQLHNDLFAQFMGARAESGRTQRAFRIPKSGDAWAAERISELLATNGADLDRLAAAISMVDSVSGISIMAKGGLMSRAAGAAGNLMVRTFINGILSGPVTHFVNVSGNAMFSMMNTAEIAVAARVGRFLPGDEHVQVGEAVAMLHGTLGATRDALRLAGKVLKSGKTIDGILKYPVDKNTITYYFPMADKPYLRRIVEGFDGLINAPTQRVMAAEDELFKTLSYRAYVEKEAMLHVQSQVAKGALELDDAAAAAREFMENTPEETARAAEAWAGDMAFQTPLGSLGQKFQTMTNAAPPLKLIAPFIRTPVNIFKESAARSPVALFTPRFWNAMKKGGRERDLALTRFAMGSGTAALVANMAIDGEITGAGPQSPEAKAAWEATGKRPYSIRVKNADGDYEWHSYARFEPIASVVGVTADTVEIMAYLNTDFDNLTDEEQQANNAAAAVIVGIMNNTGNKTFMRGISDFIEFASNPERNIRQYRNQMAVSVGVPYSAMLRAIRNTDDPYLREAWTIRDKVYDTVPGLSTSLPVSLDFFGQPRHKRSSSLMGVMSPIPESPENYNEVEREIAAVMKATNKVPVTMPERDIKGVRLNAQEYSDYVKLARATPGPDGLTFYERMQELVLTDVYQESTDYRRFELMKKMQSASDEVGRALMLEDPAFAERVMNFEMKKNRLRFDQ